MRLSGIQKLTLLDFPGRTAATVFTPGCNFRCPFCHNADLVRGMPEDAARQGGAGAPEAPARAPQAADAEAGTDSACPAGGAGGTDASDTGAAGAFPTYELADFFAFLDKRQGLLDGICITGGEPLLQPGLADFCARVRERGFAVKLDTNGSLPGRLRALVDAGLVDYVAMDVKNAPERYAETAGVANLDLTRIRESVAFLMEGRVACEFRTTVVDGLHTEDNLLGIARWLADAKAGQPVRTEAGNVADAAAGIERPAPAGTGGRNGQPARATAGTGAETEADPKRPACTAAGAEAGWPPWFLQGFIDGEGVLGGTGRFHAWEPDGLRRILPELQRIVPTAALRGID